MEIYKILLMLDTHILDFRFQKISGKKNVWDMKTVGDPLVIIVLEFSERFAAGALHPSHINML